MDVDEHPYENPFLHKLPKACNKYMQSFISLRRPLQFFLLKLPPYFLKLYGIIYMNRFLKRSIARPSIHPKHLSDFKLGFYTHTIVDNYVIFHRRKNIYAMVSCKESSHFISLWIIVKRKLCWFQTSLPLAALPLCRVIIACCFRVAALSGNAALALSPSGIAPELHRIQLSAICRGGQSGKVIDLLAWRCLPLGHPSAASGACAVEQISSSKRQCGKRQVSLKPA